MTEEKRDGLAVPSRAGPSRAGPILVGAARLVLGALWLHEGILKYRAGFGAADIRLVADSATNNSRVPDFYAVFADRVLGSLPELFGFVIPLLETGLGIALILGIVTLPAALGAVLTLMLYWLADQLAGQYPVMLLLAVVVVVWPDAASRFSIKTATEARVRGKAMQSILHGPFRRWL